MMKNILDKIIIKPQINWLKVQVHAYQYIDIYMFCLK